MSKKPDLGLATATARPFNSSFELTIKHDETSKQSGYQPSKPASALFIMSLLLETMGIVISQMTEETLKRQQAETERFMGKADQGGENAT